MTKPYGARVAKLLELFHWLARKLLPSQLPLKSWWYSGSLVFQHWYPEISRMEYRRLSSHNIRIRIWPMILTHWQSVMLRSWIIQRILKQNYVISNAKWFIISFLASRDIKIWITLCYVLSSHHHKTFLSFVVCLIVFCRLSVKFIIINHNHVKTSPSPFCNFHIKSPSQKRNVKFVVILSRCCVFI